MRINLGCIGAAFLLVSGCATGINIQKYNAAPATKDSFVVCHGYSCTNKTATSFNKKEWAAIAKHFKDVKSAQKERVRIAEAVSIMEEITGRKTGTDVDDPEAVGFKTSIFQMDCIDETVNTTQYLQMLQQNGLLKFHAMAEPTHRGYFIDGRWPHNTAVVKEKKTGDLYVVDSFYKANGKEPYIMPRQTWLNGWKPKGSKQ